MARLLPPGTGKPIFISSGAHRRPSLRASPGFRAGLVFLFVLWVALLETADKHSKVAGQATAVMAEVALRRGGSPPTHLGPHALFVSGGLCGKVGGVIVVGWFVHWLPIFGESFCNRIMRQERSIKSAG